MLRMKARGDKKRVYYYEYWGMLVFVKIKGEGRSG